MRTVQIAVVILLIGLCGYAYTHDQPGCEKILNDFVELGKALASPKPIPEKPSASPATSPATSDAAPPTDSATPSTELGRTGYVEGAGPTGLIADLANYCK